MLHQHTDLAHPAKCDPGYWPPISVSMASSSLTLGDTCARCDNGYKYNGSGTDDQCSPCFPERNNQHELSRRAVGYLNHFTLPKASPQSGPPQWEPGQNKACTIGVPPNAPNSSGTMPSEKCGPNQERQGSQCTPCEASQIYESGKCTDCAANTEPGGTPDQPVCVSCRENDAGRGDAGCSTTRCSGYFNCSGAMVHPTEQNPGTRTAACDAAMRFEGTYYYMDLYNPCRSHCASRGEKEDGFLHQIGRFCNACCIEGP